MIEKAIIGVAATIVIVLFGCAGVFAAILGGGDATTAIVNCDPPVALSPAPSGPATNTAGQRTSAAVTVSTTDPTANCLTAVAVLKRADTWLTADNGRPVPYLSSGDPKTWFDGYRRDCSGYASMALGLTGPGLNTAGLAAHSTPITTADLRPGDLLINPAPGGAGHVVIFDHWANAAMTSYIGYEQSGDSGTHHRTIPYPYFGNYQMAPYRYGASSTAP